MPMPVVHSLEVTIPRREVLRYLGYPRARQPSDRIGRRVDELDPCARELVDGRGLFVLATRDEADRIGMPSPSERVAFGVCTIGGRLDRELERLNDEGDVLGALILDAFGSAAAEQAAEGLHARVCAAVQSDGLRAGRRVSPGYGKWHVSRQSDLLAHLSPELIGIRLNEASMMSPRKSVSFAVVLTSGMRHAPAPGRCASCELVDCRYRRADPGRSMAAEEAEG